MAVNIGDVQFRLEDKLRFDNESFDGKYISKQCDKSSFVPMHTSPLLVINETRPAISRLAFTSHFNVIFASRNSGSVIVNSLSVAVPSSAFIQLCTLAFDWPPAMSLWNS